MPRKTPVFSSKDQYILTAESIISPYCKGVWGRAPMLAQALELLFLYP